MAELSFQLALRGCAQDAGEGDIAPHSDEPIDVSSQRQLPQAVHAA